MSKFVLIDHSICNLAGHHYEYAVHVLRAAERAGYEPILATNRKFAGQEKTTWPVFRVYEFGFWSEPAEDRNNGFLHSRADWIRRMKFVCKCRLRYSSLGLAWLGRTDWARYLSRKPRGVAGVLGHVVGAVLIAAAKLLRLLGLLLLLPLWLLALPLWALWRLLEFITSPQPFRRYVKALSNELRTYYEFAKAAATSAGRLARRMSGRRKSSRQRSVSESFSRDTRTLFDKVRLEPGDVVFFPTISHRDMLGLLDFFHAVEPSSGVSWHLLFRRNLYLAVQEDDTARNEAAAEIRSAFETFQRGIGDRIVRFYTDSDELTRQYERLGTFPFQTLPIPHTYSPQDRTSSGGPLQITYLGDARREKGYQLLPRIVSDLRHDYAKAAKVRFVLQSNYNVSGGEPEAVIARAQLESLPASMVELYTEALSTEAYKKLLLSADIVLLPYDQTNYCARSSGVLVEALAAGIPVIVPAGTWLSWQLVREENKRRYEILRNQMTLPASYRQSSLSWRCRGSPEVSAVVDGRLEAGFERKAYCRFEVPSAATHLLVTLSFVGRRREGSLSITPMDEDEIAVHPVKHIFLQGDSQGQCGVVLPLPPGAHSLWFALGSRRKNEQIEIQNVRIDLLCHPADKPVPLGAVGLAYHDVQEISGLLREMVDHYPHYRKTATEFAERWRRFHNADRLVEEIGLQLSGGAGASTPLAASAPRDPGQPREQDSACA